ncbi:MAG TPA: HlyD family efflux transporter periplasmic adaptor subunit, partial [Thermoanaerobaculia bacterium]|nr:HlyD family efflux transporter periplasmic adaptor subunit [Thermoanaerobaculia bacterium]
MTVVLLITLGLSRLKPAAPTVEKSAVWLDTVKRGPMRREVRGPGSLVPESEGILQISAATDARVERLLLQPGSPVQPSSILLEMSNPELQRDGLDAEWQLKAAQAELVNTRIRLEKELMDQQAAAATVRSDFHQAQLQAETNEGLYKEGLVADLTLKLSKVRAEELSTRNEIERKRLEVYSQSAKAQGDVQQAKVEQLRALAQLKRSQLEALHVRAGIEGVLQELPLQVGQRVVPGTTLAKVVQPNRLKAQLKIAETQAKDIVIGQPASIDTRNGVVPGKVSRVDPAVQNGTVTVDVVLAGALPKGARPDLSVDGTIELDRLADVVYVGRPAFGQEQNQISLFRVNGEGDDAQRVKVRLGKSSVNTVQVLEGLKPGDRVILSDMSAWDA